MVPCPPLRNGSLKMGRAIVIICVRSAAATISLVPSFQHPLEGSLELHLPTSPLCNRERTLSDAIGRGLAESVRYDCTKTPEKLGGGEDPYPQNRVAQSKVKVSDGRWQGGLVDRRQLKGRHQNKDKT